MLVNKCKRIGTGHSTHCRSWVQQSGHDSAKLRIPNRLRINRKLTAEVHQVTCQNRFGAFFEVFAQPDFFETLNNITAYYRLFFNLFLRPKSLGCAFQSSVCVVSRLGSSQRNGLKHASSIRAYQPFGRSTNPSLLLTGEPHRRHKSGWIGHTQLLE